MGAHGHRRIKDLIFGTTIDPVRHALKVPILVVREMTKGATLSHLACPGGTMSRPQT